LFFFFEAGGRCADPLIFGAGRENSDRGRRAGPGHDAGGWSSRDQNTGRGTGGRLPRPEGKFFHRFRGGHAPVNQNRRSRWTFEIDGRLGRSTRLVASGPCRSQARRVPWAREAGTSDPEQNQPNIKQPDWPAGPYQGPKPRHPNRNDRDCDNFASQSIPRGRPVLFQGTGDHGMIRESRDRKKKGKPTKKKQERHEKKETTWYIPTSSRRRSRGAHRFFSVFFRFLFFRVFVVLCLIRSFSILRSFVVCLSSRYIQAAQGRSRRADAGAFFTGGPVEGSKGQVRFVRQGRAISERRGRPSRDGAGRPPARASNAGNWRFCLHGVDPRTLLEQWSRPGGDGRWRRCLGVRGRRFCSGSHGYSSRRDDDRGSARVGPPERRDGRAGQGMGDGPERGRRAKKSKSERKRRAWGRVWKFAAAWIRPADPK